MAVPYQKYADFLRELHCLNCHNICNITAAELSAALSAKNLFLEILLTSPSTPKNDNEFKRFLNFLSIQYENEVLTENKYFKLKRVDDIDCIASFLSMKLAIMSMIKIYLLQLDY